MRNRLLFVLVVCGSLTSLATSQAQQAPDHLRAAQLAAIETGKADWGYWGTNPEKYTGWTNHSNRLIPVYLFGGTLDSMQGSRSVYRDPQRLTEIYGEVPAGTRNPTADYFDQTELFQLQKAAVQAGKKYIFVIFGGY